MKNICGLLNTQKIYILLGSIREPKGVDFIIQSEPLNEKERKAISQFISDYKSKNSKTEPKKASNKPENSFHNSTNT